MATAEPFADSHADRRKWLDPRVTPPINKRGTIGIVAGGPIGPDLAWLRSKTTGPKTLN